MNLKFAIPSRVILHLWLGLGLHLKVLLKVCLRKQPGSFHAMSIVEAISVYGEDRVRTFPTIVDTGAGHGHQRVAWEASPCLTSSRGKSQAWYCPWRKQKLTIVELSHLQGLAGCQSQSQIVTQIVVK